MNGWATGVQLQYNDPECKEDYCNIQRICSKLTTRGKPPLDLLADIYKTNVPSRECLAEILRSVIAALQNGKSSDEGRMSEFHACTSRGLYPTCSQASCPFFTGRDRDYFYYAKWLCELGFGLSDKEILEGIEELKAYVGDFRSTTNILSINGDADPWYPSSIYEEGEGPEVEM
ncbi:Thymus-specific serine protease, partial [Perkinsus chesapeaki]